MSNKASTKTQLTIKADDGTVDEITSTPGHKYYLPDNKRNRRPGEKLEHASYECLGDKWVSACDLKKGDRVLLANADSLTGKPKYGIVKNVKTEQCDEPFITYNFEVADFHTYYVGENGVCVHNVDCGVPEMSYDDLSSDAKAAYDGYSSNGWQGNYKGQPVRTGTVANGPYNNNPVRLPTQDGAGNLIKYRKFDVVTKVAGAGRNAERFVVGNHSLVYFTNDHYATFFRIIR